MSDGKFSRRRFLRSLGVTLAAVQSARAVRAQILTAHDYLRKLARDAPLEMVFNGSSAEECREWQDEFEQTLRSLLGPFRPPDEWRTTLERREEYQDHVRDELILEATGFPALPIYYLRPPGVASRIPGVLALHGHGSFGYDPVAGKDHDPRVAESIAAANYDYGRQLARKGYAVVAPCFTPFGRRADSREAYGGDDICAVTYLRLQMFGKLLIAENLRDALWAFEFLSRQDACDADRIGCVGLSYGGRMTMLTTALEKRIRAAVISGALNVMQERILLRYSCGAQIIPGLLQYGDVPEIASLIAPRPCLWEVGTEDGLIDPDWAEGALGRIRRAYSAFGAPENLQVDRFQGGHRWNGVMAYPLLEKVLKKPAPGRNAEWEKPGRSAKWEPTR